MLTRLQIKNFKKLENVDIELGKSVVFIGPNNSGKTAALQALALWDVGLKQWKLKRSGKVSAKKRAGVVINRKDLFAIPVPELNLLWRNLHVRSTTKKDGKQSTKNIRIDIIVDGITDGKAWSCGLEFDYANLESLYCRPLRSGEAKQANNTEISADVPNIDVAFLPPMSGLADREFIKQPGEIGILIGQGQTAQVLRNLCYQIYSKPEGDLWKKLTEHMKELFGAELLPPKYYEGRSEITLGYKEGSNNELDISVSGRGLQQTLLLLAHLYANQNTTLLLDEPDAHLEVFRQRQTYQLITEVAQQQGSQIIAASHSEVVLNEAAGKDIVIAFVGKPHRINDRVSQVLKALKDIGFDHYYLAEQNGWVLYLEGSTDLANLQAFARKLHHKAERFLERPFVHYVGNQPSEARKHFHGLREAYPKLVGVALFDKLEKKLEEDEYLEATMWQRSEIENYFCMEEVLLAYARYDLPDDLFGQKEADDREKGMKDSIEVISNARKTLGKPGPWSPEIKATEFMEEVFRQYFDGLKLPNLLQKTNYHILARFVSPGRIDPEVSEKLDLIAKVARKASPITD